MKRSAILVAVFSLLAAAAASAQTMDFSLDGNATLSRYSEAALSYAQNATLNLGLPLGSAFTFNARIGAGASLSASSAGVGFNYPDSLGAIDLQELDLVYTASTTEEGLNALTVKFGRIPYSDASGTLYAYRLDGIIVAATLSPFILRGVAGFTAALPGAAPIIASSADLSYGNAGFAPPRAVMSFGLRTIPLAGHEFYLAAVAQEDLRDASQLIPEYEIELDEFGAGKSDSAYLVGGFSGALANFSYSAYGAWQFGRRLAYQIEDATESGFVYRYVPVQALSIGAALGATLSQALTLAGRLQFATGDASEEGAATDFVPITRGSAGLVFSPLPANLTLVEFTAAYKPFPKEAIGWRAVQGTAKTLVFLKNGAGAVSEPGIQPDTDFCPLGFEQDVSLSCRLLSDFTANIAVGAFLPFAEPFGAFNATFTAASPLMFILRAGFTLTL